MKRAARERAGANTVEFVIFALPFVCGFLDFILIVTRFGAIYRQILNCLILLIVCTRIVSLEEETLMCMDL